MDKRWLDMTEKEKLEIINPLLDNIKSVLLSDNTTHCHIANYSEDEKPEIRNGAGELIHNLSYMATTTIEIKVNMIKKT